MSDEEKKVLTMGNLTEEEVNEKMRDFKPVLVSSKPNDEDIARDLKYRIQQAMIPVLEIMDEALAHRMHVRWDGLGPISDGFNVKNGISNLHIVRIYT